MTDEQLADLQGMALAGEYHYVNLREIMANIDAQAETIANLQDQYEAAHQLAREWGEKWQHTVVKCSLTRFVNA